MNSTINQLTSELTNLASESKRRNADIKQASEKSLEVLKGYNHTKTTEAQFLKSLSKNPDFITPFLLSCQTRNPKYISISISCFHKLITSQSIPITKLELVLDAFIESTNLAIEIQLKILQCLPFLFQNYSIFINDKNLFKLLSVCSILQNSNKSNIVNNTASATLSQLINLVFEKISDEDKIPEIDKSYVVPIDNDETTNVGLNAYDGQRIFQDLCTLIEHHKPQFLRTNYITENFGFEILESVIKTNREIFLKHIELGFLLRTRVVPILLRFFSSSKDFTIMVRVARLVLLVIKEQFENLKLETEVILSLLNHILTKDSSSPYWKKILSLEIYKHIFTNFKLLESFFVEFDYQNDSKQIINDFLQNCFDILNDQKFLLNTGEIVQPPISTNFAKPSSSASSSSSHQVAQQQSHGSSQQQQHQQQQHEIPGLFVTKSTIKINFIDLLDKSDPPAVNETYALYLILSTINNFCEGVCKYALDMAQNNDQTDNDKDDGHIKQLILQNYKTLLSMYQIIIFSTLDADFFNKSIRSVQKICHASGILSIVEPRDDFLKLLIKATLNLSGKSGFQYKNSVYSLGESIVGTISSTINQALTTTPNQTHSFYTRQINSRNVLCFRVLVSLAISLGPVLQHEDWRLIFISLQWMDYYINGPSEATRDVPPPPQLASADIINVENSIKKLNENINFYSTSVFEEIVKSVISLSNEVINEGGSMFNKQPVLDHRDQSNGEDDDGYILIQPCSYNKIFYINKMMELCKINSKKFLIEQNSSWEIILKHYFELISNRALNYEFRVTISKDFNSIIKYMAIDGFDSKVDKTEWKILKSLEEFVNSLINLSKPEEMLILNCELEIQSQILDSLKYLLDKYGSNFQHWDLVFNIINSSFVRESNNEKLKPVINSSFEGLKMILDEFLSSLPSNQLKILIDCISNFISQDVDLNISLNSISYFWLIGDFLRGSITKKSTRHLKDEEELFQLVVEKNDDFNLLYIYLLHSLSETIQDPRLQVRNGSIQTFFNIIDSHGNFFQNWSNIYGIIFTKLLKTQNSDLEWLESYHLTLNGFVKLYNKFLSNFNENDTDEKIKYWHSLISFFNQLISLNNIDLSLKVYKNFLDLISPFQPLSLPSEILQDLYNFWSSSKIIYNLAQNNLYQDSLTSLMECFPKFFELIQPILSIDKYQQILTILNSCVKYPVLPDYFQNDDLRLTNLQESVFTNLTTLVNASSADQQVYNSLLLQQLNSIVVLPFATRDKIVQKFSKLNQQQSNFKIPSFISISHRTMNLLDSQLTKCTIDTTNLTYLLQDGSILKIYKSLLEPIKLKAKGISIKQDLWIQCMDLLMDLNAKIVKVSQDDQNWWVLVIELIEILNGYDKIDEDIEKIDVEYLTKLYDLIIINNVNNLTNELLTEFVKIIFRNSFMYELNEIDTNIAKRDSIEYCLKLPIDKLNDTIDLQISTRLSLKKFNLLKLIELNDIDKLESHYFQLRLCFTIWKFLNFNHLVNKSPVFQLQKFEMLHLLQGYLKILHHDRKKNHVLKPLILKLLPFMNKIENLPTLITNILDII